ncbi:MAG: TatD family hydrolase [Eubacteriales bacterium]|nr:TatD family hydrolase [Eubacteriales bacterium]
MIFDTHAHYDDRQFEDDREELLGVMQENGIGWIVDAGSDIASWDKIEELTKRYPFVYGAIGVHPDEVGELDEEKMQQMERLLAKEKMVAVGEIGLDYYWDKENRDLQKKWLILQLELARRLDLPVIIHSREAAADTMEIMKQHAKGLDGVIHCFSYSLEQAKEYVNMGFYLGIGGVVTFKNGTKLKEVVQEIPLEFLVLETDSPYLAPVPHRGKRNNSQNLVYVAEEIAALKGVSYEEVVRQTTENAKKLYRLEK